jgi:hypothetical protein
MAQWKSRAHLEDHFGRHRRELRVRLIEEYDASAQETIALGRIFRYRDRRTQERRIGYYHLETARFVGLTMDHEIVTHYRTDEAEVYSMLESTYWDD